MNIVGPLLIAGTSSADQRNSGQLGPIGIMGSELPPNNQANQWRDNINNRGNGPTGTTGTPGPPLQGTGTTTNPGNSGPAIGENGGDGTPIPRVGYQMGFFGGNAGNSGTESGTGGPAIGGGGTGSGGTGGGGTASGNGGSGGSGGTLYLFGTMPNEYLATADHAFLVLPGHFKGTS